VVLLLARYDLLALELFALVELDSALACSPLSDALVSRPLLSAEGDHPFQIMVLDLANLCW